MSEAAINFDGKVALVTGGAAGIGRATALAFARHGAQVMVVDREAGEGRETARLIEAAGGAAAFQEADVSRSADVRAYVEATLARFGRIDCFFNNAGIEGRVVPIHEADEEAFDQVIAVNLRGVFLGLRHVLEVMVRQGGGCVVNTSSVGGLVGAAGLAPYIASKHGVLGLTKSAAADMALFGIRVNAVCPGPIETRMIRSIETQRAARGGTPAAPASFGLPEDVANLVLFLSSGLAGNVTGAGYVTDGGRTAISGAERLMR